jgi:TolA-binding protein
MTKAISAKSRGKISKKELKQDKLVEFTVKVEAFYNRHKNWVISVLTAVLVIVAAVVLIGKSQKSARMEESFQLTMAKMKYGSGQLDDANQDFQKILTDYSGRPAGEAQYFIARIAFEKGDFASAESGFEAYLKNYSVDPAMNAAALSGYAASQEAEGNLEGAMQSYQRLAQEYPSNAYAPQSLLEVSRLAQALGKDEESTQALRKILDKYSESTAVQQARKDLDNLE